MTIGDPDQPSPSAGATEYPWRETKRTGQDGYAIAVIGAIIGGLAVAGWVI